MIKAITILLTASLLSACMAPGRVVASNARSVTVRAGTGAAGEAQKAADTECAKHGRIAQSAGKNGPHEWVYDCVL
jgi:hypothetical protein